MPETKKYCTPLHKENIVLMPVGEDILEEFPDGNFDRGNGEPINEDLDRPEFSDDPNVPEWEDRNKDTEFGITDESTPQPTCEANPKSIGCKVLGDQFIFTINGLVKDLEELKPPGYILAIGKLKGAIIKLQAGN